MKNGIQVLALTFFCLLTLGLVPSHCQALPREWAWKWDPPLTGKELLLELEFKTNRQIHGIYAVDPEGGKARLLIPGGERPVWSPRRTYISYLMGEELRLTRRGGESDVYYHWAIRSDHDNPTEPPLVWCPNEAGFARVEHYPIGRDLLEILAPLRPGERLWTEQSITCLTPIPGFHPVLEPGEAPPTDPLFRPSYNSPTFSPDGMLACEIYPSKPLARSESRIYVMDLHGQWRNTFQKKRLTDWGPGTIELQPLWSPSGEWIAFVSVDNKSREVVTCVSPGPGKEVVKLSFGGDAMIGKWTPRDLQSEDRVRYLVPVEWSPDGKRLLLKEPNDGSFFIYVAQWNGKEWEAKKVGESRRQCGFGSDAIWVAAVNGANRPTYSSDFISLENVDDGNASKPLKLPPGCRVLWMDW